MYHTHKPTNPMHRLSNLLLALCLAPMLTGCHQPDDNQATSKAHIAALLDSLNLAAARADYTAYFGLYADSAVFAGTDATERWDKMQFMAYAKPHFDRGKAWAFTALNRHIYIDKAGQTAWFDELLRTQMKICRGSGVATRHANGWKIEQYILSATIPNSLMDSITTMKTPAEDNVMESMQQAKTRL